MDIHFELGFPAVLHLGTLQLRNTWLMRFIGCNGIFPICVLHGIHSMLNNRRNKLRHICSIF